MAKIDIYIPNEEAQQFLLFKQNYEKFVILLSSGVFNQKNATILLDFDSSGELRGIRRQDSLYTYKKDLTK